MNIKTSFFTVVQGVGIWGLDILAGHIGNADTTAGMQQRFWVFLPMAVGFLLLMQLGRPLFIRWGLIELSDSEIDALRLPDINAHLNALERGLTEQETNHVFLRDIETRFRYLRTRYGLGLNNGELMLYGGGGYTPNNESAANAYTHLISTFKIEEEEIKLDLE